LDLVKETFLRVGEILRRKNFVNWWFFPGFGLGGRKNWRVLDFNLT